MPKKNVSSRKRTPPEAEAPGDLSARPATLNTPAKAETQRPTSVAMRPFSGKTSDFPGAFHHFADRFLDLKNRRTDRQGQLTRRYMELVPLLVLQLARSGIKPDDLAARALGLMQSSVDQIQVVVPAFANIVQNAVHQSAEAAAKGTGGAGTRPNADSLQLFPDLGGNSLAPAAVIAAVLASKKRTKKELIGLVEGPFSKNTLRKIEKEQPVRPDRYTALATAIAGLVPDFSREWLLPRSSQRA